MRLQDLISEVDMWLSEVPGIEKKMLSIISLAGNLSASTGDPAQRQKFKDLAPPAREQLGKLEEYKHQLEKIVDELKAAKTQEEFNLITPKKAEIQKELEKTKDWAEKLEAFLQGLQSKQARPASQTQRMK